jgi:preprotein translocase subunit SecG
MGEKMTNLSESKSLLTPRQTSAVIVAAVYALLNLVSLSSWFSDGGQVFIEGEWMLTFTNFMWLLAPLGYIGLAIFVLLRKPNIAVWLLVFPALSVLSNMVFGLMNSYGLDYVLPLISLVNFTPDYWAGSLLMATEFFAVVVIAILLLNTKKVPRGISNMSSNSPINKPNFCPSCGSPAGDGDFCSKCGTNLGNSSSANSSNGVFSETSTTSTMAVVAFILSFFVPIVGLILGYISRKEIDQSGGRISGRGFATAAIVLNWIWIAFIVIWIIGAVSFAAQY